MQDRIACSTCHARKVRCDAHEVGLPCSGCIAASRSDCRLHQKRKRASRSSTEQVQARGSRVFLSESPTRDSRRTEGPVRRDVGRQQTSEAGNDTTHNELSSVYQAPLPQSPALSDEAFPAPGTSEEGDHMYRRYLVEFVDQPELVTRPIDSQARVTHVGTDVSNVNYLVRQHYGPNLHSENVAHYPTNRFAQRYAAREPSVRLPLEAFEMPPRATVDELLDAFFRHINPGFPVVDETLFMEQYSARDPSDPPSLLLLQAILVAGAHALYSNSNSKARRATSKAMFFRRAKTLLEGHFERNRDTIVQAALLLTWHTDGVEDVTANAWHWLGLAIRTAMGLGMHRDTERSTLVPHNKRMWRRVWWLLFVSDVWVSIQYGRPQGIHLEDCTVGDPRIEDFQDCGSDACPDQTIQSVRLAVIVSEVVRARARSQTSEEKQNALEEADKRLATWVLQLPRELQRPGSDCDVASANLHLHYNAVLILLHRSKPPTNSDRQADGGTERHVDTAICVSAASTIQAHFQSIRHSAGMKSLWLSSVNCLFTALIQLSCDVQFTNPLLAVSNLQRFESALSLLQELAEFWPNAQSIAHFFEQSVKGGSRHENRSHEPSIMLQMRQQGENMQRTSETAQITRRLQRPSTPCPPGAAESRRNRAFVGSDAQGSSANARAPPQNVAACFDMSYCDTRDIHDAWRNWQTQEWQTEFSDEFLFTF